MTSLKDIVLYEDHFPSSCRPLRYATQHSACVDLVYANGEPYVLSPGARALLPSGIRLAMPKTMEALIRPRSGLAFRYGITVLNSPGTIDADYADEVKILLINHGEKPYTIQPADRIAQCSFAYVCRPDTIEVQAVQRTGGFGSTGL